MLGELLSAGLSAATKLFGGAREDKAVRENNAQNLAFQREQLDRNEALQREFAQSGVQWKVSDAEKAGIHPLYALGAQTQAFSPITMGASSEAATGTSRALSDMGQDVSRAIRATTSNEDRVYDTKMRALNLRKAELENNLLASKIATTTGAGIGPGLPTGRTRPLIPDASPAAVVPEQKEHDERKLLGLYGKWKTNPYVSPAEPWSDQYGDVVESLIGIPNFLVDAVTNASEAGARVIHGFGTRQYKKFQKYGGPAEKPRQSRYW